MEEQPLVQRLSGAQLMGRVCAQGVLESQPKHRDQAVSHRICAVQAARSPGLLSGDTGRSCSVLRAGGCSAGLVWHRRAVPSPGWCQCPGRSSKLQRLLPAQGTNPPPAVSSMGVPALLRSPACSRLVPGLTDLQLMVCQCIPMPGRSPGSHCPHGVEWM